MPAYRLLEFSTGKGIPVFVVPPTAGRHPNISQPLIDKCIAQGRSVYTFELKEATHATRSTSVSNLITGLDTCIRWVGEPVDLVGICQGGWLSAMCAALFPENTNRLALFAAPIDTRTGESNGIENYMEKRGIIDIHKKIVEINEGLQKGFLQWTAFSATDPFYNYFGQWIDLWLATWGGDAADLVKQKRNLDWNMGYQDIAGTWFLDVLENHFLKNKLYTGQWKFEDRVINLKNITCPIFLYAGGADKITHQKQLFNITKKIGTRPADTHKTLFAGAGHTKCFCGREELEHFINQFLK